MPAARASLFLFAALFAALPAAFAPADVIEVREAQLTAAESWEVATARAGLLQTVAVAEGDLVEQGALLAKLDTRRAELEARQADEEAKLAEYRAADDTEVRHVTKTHELAAVEYERAVAVNKRIPDSVSKREVGRLKLTREQAALAIEKAEHDRRAAQMESRLLRGQARLARLTLEEHRMHAPADAMVTELVRRPGEWVEAGATVMRLTRVDVIRVEGFLEAAQAMSDLRGRSATLRVVAPGAGEQRLEGVVTFVAPEANPVNGAVRVRAEFTRGELPVRPGLRAGLTINEEPVRPPGEPLAGAGSPR